MIARNKWTRGARNYLYPVNLSLKIRKIALNPPNITGFKISRLLYLLHLILEHKQKDHAGAYSVLNMQFMLSIIPKANEYLNHLRNLGIIEWKNYKAGRNSRLYRLVGETTTVLRPITDNELILRIKKTYANIGRKKSHKYPNLNQYIYKVKLDYDAALKTIEETYNSSQRKIISKRFPNVTFKSLDQDANRHREERRTYSLAAIEKIKNGEIYISVNDTNYRLDSNYTNLPSELLKHLTIDGKPLVEIDIVNSQPFFAATLFEPHPEIQTIMKDVLGKNYTMLAKTLQNMEYEDVELYTLLVTNGKFYEYMEKKFKENNIPYKDRSDLKEQMFVIFFGSGISYKYNQAAKLFKNEFPHVYNIFYQIKQKNPHKQEKKPYNKLAILLQRIESHIMLNKVAKTIIKEHPNIPIITRHDSILPSVIMAREDDIYYVKGILVDEVEKITGFIPQIKVK
jgi:hypothetical protein